jgi:uncharacterized membrane protein YgdD (TMEM256/DUF423 family)
LAKVLLFLAAILGGVGVGIGALGAHSLPDWLVDQGLDAEGVAKRLDNCETAVRYQMFHVLAVLAIALSGLTTRSAAARAASVFMLVGVLLFCGGLYMLVFLDFLGHWSIVPLGGLHFLIGWGLLAVSAFGTGTGSGSMGKAGSETQTD